MKFILQNFTKFLRLPFLWAILLYQKTFSPDHGWFKHKYPHGYCKYYPTCSEYGYRVIAKKGLIRGIPLTLWRIAKCNPWTKGGVDEVK